MVKVIQVSNNMEMNVPFLVEGFKLFSDCLGHLVLWEAANLRPYAKGDGDLVDTVGRQPSKVVEDVKPI